MIYQAVVKLSDQIFSIDRRVESIDTEIIVIIRGRKTDISKAVTKFTSKIIVYSDNKAAVEILNGIRSETCKKDVQQIHTLQQNWRRREKLNHVKPGGIFGKWIRGHTGNRENLEADTLAKTGAINAILSEMNNNPSYAAVKKLVYDKRKQSLEEWWANHTPTRYKTLKIQVI